MEAFFMGFLIYILSKAVWNKKFANLPPDAKKIKAIMAEFHRQAEQMLLPGEIVEASCGCDPCAAVTNQRLLITTGQGILPLPFSEIRGLSRSDAGAPGHDPKAREVLTICAGRKYFLANTADGFEEVYEALKRHI